MPIIDMRMSAKMSADPASRCSAVLGFTGNFTTGCDFMCGFSILVCGINLGRSVSVGGNGRCSFFFCKSAITNGILSSINCARYDVTTGLSSEPPPKSPPEISTCCVRACGVSQGATAFVAQNFARGHPSQSATARAAIGCAVATSLLSRSISIVLIRRMSPC